MSAVVLQKIYQNQIQFCGGSMQHSLNATETDMVGLYEYEHGIQLGRCDTCVDCHKKIPNLSRPLALWGIGDDFSSNDKRILFVGKNARGYNEPIFRRFPFICSNINDTRTYLWDSGMPYWNYTKCIAEKIFGDTSFENIACTNIVKCNNSEDVDTTTDYVKNNCIKKLGVISKEIEVIRPTHIIFYTGSSYDSYIKNDIFDSFVIKFDGRKPIGRKQMVWLEAEAKFDFVKRYGSKTIILSEKELKFFVLRTGHPMCTDKDAFVDSVCDWIERNP